LQVAISMILFVTLKRNIVVQEMIPWMATREEAYHALCHYWTTDEFKSISQRNRGNRRTESYHTYEGDGHFRLAKRIVSELFEMNSINFIYQCMLL
jgi:hypothetical protein